MLPSSLANATCLPGMGLCMGLFAHCLRFPEVQEKMFGFVSNLQALQWKAALHRGAAAHTGAL